MKLIDQFGREIGEGDSIIPKDQSIQNWLISKIESNILSAAPGSPPMVKVTYRCEITCAFPDLGQPTTPLPVYIVRKAADAPGAKKCDA